MSAALVVTYGEVGTTTCAGYRCDWSLNGMTWSALDLDAAVHAARFHVESTGHRVDVDRTVRTRVTPSRHAGPSVPLHDLDRAAS